MKITDLQNDQAVQYLNPGGKANAPEKPPGTQETSKTGIPADKVEISSQSRDLKKIHDILEKTPDVRAEKVAALKKAIEEGRYQVSAEKIAERMIEQILVESSRE